MKRIIFLFFSFLLAAPYVGAQANAGIPAQVNFPDVTFLHAEGAFYRLYPVSDAAYVAVKRDVTVMTDTKSSSYGMTSSTTAVEEIGMVQSDGHLVSFNDARQYPYKMTETAYLYRNGYLLQESRNRSLVRGAQESRCHRHPDGSRPVQGMGRITT